MDVKCLSLTEYLSLPTPPQSWIVQDLVPACGMVALWGPPKEGKTLLSLSLALAIAQGRPFLGRHTSQGPTLLLELDTSDHLFRQMVLQTQAAGLDCSGPLYLPDPQSLKEHYPFRLVDSSASFYLHSLIAAVQPSLVIVDCFREIGDHDENESGEQKPVISALKALTTFHPTHPCACLLLHHTRKIRPDEPLDVKGSGRGSGYLAGAVDSIWFLYQSRLHIQPRFAEPSSIPLVQGPGGVWALRHP